MDPDVEGVDELYELEPGEFVAARDELARRLREGGDRSAAAAVRKLRRPTVTAWALNQVVRRHRPDVEAMLSASRDAADAQERALAGDGGDLRDALRARSDSLHHVAGLVERLLDERGSTGERAEVLEALSAAAGDEETGAALLEARLDRPPVGTSGLGSLGSLDDALAASLAVTRAPAARTSGPKDRKGGRRRPTTAEEAEEAEPDRAAELERERELQREEEQQRERQRRLAAAAEEARAELARRVDRLRHAEDRRADAEHEVRRAESALESARAELQERQDEVEELTAGRDEQTALVRAVEEELRQEG